MSPLRKHTSSQGLSTYRSFILMRDGLRQVLAAASRGDASPSALRENTSLGSVQIEAMPRFAHSSGLLDAKRSLTSFGKQVNVHDPLMSSPRTQVVMHYHMCNPATSGPRFWQALFGHIASHSAVRRSDLAEFLVQSGAATSPTNRAVTYAVRAFIGTYTDSAALGALGVIRVKDGVVSLGQSVALSSKPVAYVVADYWAHMWTTRTDVDLSAFSGPGSPASLLLMSSSEMTNALGDMEARGWVQIHRKVPPYKVVRLWKDSQEMLERLYD